MTHFLHDTRGSASLLAAFLVVVLFLLAVVAYAGATVYSTYQSAQTELERAASFSVDASLVNANVRDLMLDIHEEDVVQQIYANLSSVGFVQGANSDWMRMEGEKTLYWLKNIQTMVSGRVLDVTATLAIPLPWTVGGFTRIELPISICVNVLYLD